MYYDELDDDDVGTSPINLPDPSVFSDLGENERPYYEQDEFVANTGDN